MLRKSASTIRPSHSGVPALAGAIAALAFVAGGAAFSLGVQQAETGSPAIQASLEKSARTIAPLATEWEAATTSEEALVEETLGDLPDAVPVTASEVVPVDPRSLTAAEPVAPLPDGPRIVLVIDDVGLDLAAAQRVIDLPVATSLAVLPYADAATTVAQRARRAGRDVLVHMPMEPLGLADPGPNALRLGLEREDLELRARWAMARVPGAIGFNNHMGSRFTQDPAALRIAMSAIAEEGLIFLDSRTSAASRGSAVARGLGLDVLERDVFIDHELDADAILAALEEAETLALRRGHAVLIGHPHDITLDHLETWSRDAQSRGFVFVTVSEMADLNAQTLQVQASAAE